MIIVDKNGCGDFTSVQAAIDSIPEGNETVYIKNGIYKERVEIKAPNIKIIGESKENTVISYDMYAYMKGSDGIKIGTFNSYTMLVFTDNFTCENITIENTAGFGTEVGQAVAVYAEGDMIVFENCRILGHQDTLFTGPLPFKEVEKGGFRGPTEFAERRYVRQIYKGCYIEGEVDFIFGSAAAYFEDCELHSLNRSGDIKGYVTASSAYEGAEFGYIFNKCRFTGECPPATVYLGRPWRNYAQTVLLNCDIGEHITPEGFHDWNKTAARDTVFYALYNCKASGNACSAPAPFVKLLTDEEAEKYLDIPWCI